MDNQDKITLSHHLLTSSHSYQLSCDGVLEVTGYYSGDTVKIDLEGLLNLEGVEDYITTEDEYDED